MHIAITILGGGRIETAGIRIPAQEDTDSRNSTRGLMHCITKEWH
jgi:hypothetical protein